jgi:hypothetical protein
MCERLLSPHHLKAALLLLSCNLIHPCLKCHLLLPGPSCLTCPPPLSPAAMRNTGNSNISTTAKLFPLTSCRLPPPAIRSYQQKHVTGHTGGPLHELICALSLPIFTQVAVDAFEFSPHALFLHDNTGYFARGRVLCRREVAAAAGQHKHRNNAASKM